ncbi:MAG: AzlD domain-containing protein [Pseudomonadota bacterium]
MDALTLILALGALTYLTRCSGHLIVSQFGALHPRVLAALNAVPAAVLVTIVVPAAIDGGLPERLALLTGLILSFRVSMVPTILIGIAVLALLRALIGS